MFSQIGRCYKDFYSVLHTVDGATKTFQVILSVESNGCELMVRHVLSMDAINRIKIVLLRGTGNFRDVCNT